MEIIETRGGYIAISVVENYDLEKSIRWHGWNWKAGHVGIFACTRHGLTLIGVVSCGGVDEDYTWWANYHGEFYAENFSIDSYTAPDNDVLSYQGSYKDFLDCVETAAAFLWNSLRIFK